MREKRLRRNGRASVHGQEGVLDMGWREERLFRGTV